MNQKICTAKIRPFAPRNNIELTCGLGAPDHTEPYTEHMAILHDYAYEGSATEIHWREDDRRTFRGEFVACETTGPLGMCLLPKDHLGGHDW